MTQSIYQKCLAIGHRNLPYFHPLGINKYQATIERLNLKAGSTAVDFGGGKGEFIIQLIEKYGVHGTVVETPSSSAADVLKRAKGRVPSRSIMVSTEGAKRFLSTNKEKKFDLVACINSVAFGVNYKSTLSKMKSLTAPGGQVVIGLPYLLKRPSRDLLKQLNSSLGITLSDLATYQSLLAAGEKLKLSPLWATVASQDEVDQYEWTVVAEIEKYASENPNADETELLLMQARANRRLFVNSSRESLGFGLFVFRNEGVIGKTK